MDIFQDTLYNAFIHHPLTDDPTTYLIRLLKLPPATDTKAIIQGSLLHTNLSSNPTYEALSYNWGDLKVTTPMLLHSKPYPITLNLHAALTQFRLPDTGRILWVDALCINQNDIPERNVQVSQMRHHYHPTITSSSTSTNEPPIYTGPTSVLVWLGPDPSSTALQAITFTWELFDRPGNVLPLDLLRGHEEE
jgi:hypothetical protein